MKFGGGGGGGRGYGNVDHNGLVYLFLVYPARTLFFI